MNGSVRRHVSIEVRPLTPSRWPDLVELFGPRGACGGCWCMSWRLTRSVYESNKGEGNKKSFREIVRSGAEPGLLAYVGNRPVGWCAVGPREQYSVLERSRVLAPVDERSVWSVTCFFVDRKARACGVAIRLLEAAVEQARKRGARVVEGYPVEPKKSGRIPDLFAFTGVPAIFEAAGFQEVARRSKTRPVMRREL